MSGRATLDVCVRQRKREASGIASLILTSASGQDLPPFSAGAHIDLHLPGGFVRQYSLCSDPEDLSYYQVSILLSANTRGGARAAHALTPGQMLTISEPRNHFPLAADMAEALLLGGGIGVTPLLAMARTLHHRRVPFEFHYLTRSRSQAAFRRELAAAPFANTLHFHHDEEDGIITRDALAERIGAPKAKRHLYICGPEPMIAVSASVAESLQWHPDTVHFERFSPAEAVTKGAPVQLMLARSGLTIDVPEDRSLAQAICAAGIGIALSCEQGICGTCIVPVIGGIPDHRDAYLSDAEKAAGKAIALCCSRARTPTLTLDL